MDEVSDKDNNMVRHKLQVFFVYSLEVKAGQTDAIDVLSLLLALRWISNKNEEIVNEYSSSSNFLLGAFFWYDTRFHFTT